MSSTISPGSGIRPPVVDLPSSVRNQSWLWLREIERRLDFVADIVDDRGALCSPPLRGSLTSRIGENASSAFGAAVAAVIRTNQTQQLSIDGVPTLCSPLSVGRSAVGVLMLSRPSQRTLSAAPAADRGLEDIGSWLSRAVQAQLNLPVDEGDAFDRVASLHKLLQEVIESGVEEEVISVFAEALIAWDDIEVRAYAQNVHGQLTLSVATPGMDRQSATSLAVGAVPPAGVAWQRLSPAEAHHAGFRQDRDVFVAQIAGAHTQPWCVVLSGLIRGDDEPRISLYVDLLRGALDRAATIAETKVSWAILHQLLSDSGEPLVAGQAALQHLQHAIDAERIGLQVDGRGNRALTLGYAPLFAAAESATAEELVSVLSVGDGDVMTVRARRPGKAFTRREQQLVDRTAVIFSAWLSGARKRGPRPVERRAEHREFQDVVHRLVDQNVKEGLDVAVLVVRPQGTPAAPAALQQLVAEIRGRLRSGDTAGMLSEREVGVFLAGANARDVARVAGRVRQLVSKAGGGNGDVSIGFATRNAGSMVDGSLVKEARQDAVRRNDQPLRGAPDDPNV